MPLKKTTSKQSTKNTPASQNFEETLQSLEQLVDRMEQGELTLEETLQQFEQGVALTKQCQSMLEDIEQRIHTLSNSIAPPTSLPTIDTKPTQLGFE